MDRNARETRIVPGVRLDLGGPLYGSLDLGWARLRHLSGHPELPNFSGMVGEAKLLYRLGSGTTLSLDGERRVDFSIYRQNNYYTWQRYELTTHSA